MRKARTAEGKQMQEEKNKHKEAAKKAKEAEAEAKKAEEAKEKTLRNLCAQNPGRTSTRPRHLASTAFY